MILNFKMKTNVLQRKCYVLLFAVLVVEDKSWGKTTFFKAAQWERRQEKKEGREEDQNLGCALEDNLLQKV